MDQVEHRMAVYAHQRGVAERITERGHLPVENGDHLGGVLRVQDRVVDAVVAVHDRASALRRNRFCQSGMQPLDIGVRRIVLAPHQLPLRAPAAHLAFEVTGGLAEIAEPHRLWVDGVQIRKHPDQCVDAIADGVLVPELLELIGVAHDTPRHVLHHLERRTEHGVVVAHGHRTGHRHRGVLQRGHHLVLTRHVVRRRRQPVQRGPAQHPLRRVVEDQERQVRPAAGDQLGTQFTATGDADRLQVAIQGVEVKPFERGSHRTCLPSPPSALRASAHR